MLNTTCPSNCPECGEPVKASWRICNVWEWCRDVFQEAAYGRHDRLNPVIFAQGGDRVIRGGSWNLDAWSARCTRRTSLRADFFGPSLGFRLVMTRR